MTKLSPVKRKDLVAGLKKFDFKGPYIGGKHQFMIKGSIRLTLPNPHRKDIGVSLLSRLLRQANISRKKWESKK